MATVIQITQTNEYEFPFLVSPIEALLIGLDLIGYINGDIFCPPKPIASTEKKADVESKEVSNNEYHLWVQHDKLIVHTIGSSLLENLIAAFSSNTKLRVIALKRSLTMLIQGNKSVTKILQTAKTLADELALAKASIPDDELVIHIFSGINPKLNGYCHYLEIKGNNTHL
ncbi:hypothetical protein GQ457_15G021830 [Hibiscus cannabinus]